MEPVHADEVRILEGPNLYVTRPAVKVSLALPGVAQLDVHAALDLARRVGLTAEDAIVSLGQRDMLDTPQHLAEVMERVRRILDRAAAPE